MSDVTTGGLARADTRDLGPRGSNPGGSSSNGLSPQRQIGLLWGAVAAAIVALSPLGARLAPALPACPLKSWTGWPCLTCGATRTALELSHFDVLGALAISPLMTVVWIVLIGGGLVAGFAALMGYGVPEPSGRISWRWRVAVVAVVLANWWYLVWAGT